MNEKLLHNSNILLTGIQSTGIPHLGNILSVIIPTISYIKKTSVSSFIFIADLHSLTQIKDYNKLKTLTYQSAAAWLAFGLNPENVIFYKQSDVPEVTELNWYLNCFYSYQRLKLAHSFKDKKTTLKNINVGLFTYPILMASDILLYNANIVTIGKDQLQHIEITRKLANYFNNNLGKIFNVPKSIIIKKFMSIIGTDGKKMSKSRKNTIDILSSPNIIRKQIMNIKTDSKKIEEIKNPDIDIIFNIYKILADDENIEKMRQNYLKKNFGYFNAKKILYEYILEKFSKERENFKILLDNKSYLDKILINGAKKARKIAILRLNQIRSYMGFFKKIL